MRPRRVWFGLVMGLGLVPLTVDCRDATQMIVEVTTDVPCTDNPSTNIAVGRLGELAGKTTTATSTCLPNGTIGTLVVVPSDENDDELAFEVTTGVGVDPSTCAAAGAKCIVARRDLHFIPHETIRIQVPMKKVCAGVSCDPSSTCYAGGCVSATIDPAKCANGVCGEDALQSTSPPPSGTRDAAGTTPESGTGDPIDAGGIPAFRGNVTAMAMGADSTCLVSEGLVYCWGWNHDGQLGIGEARGRDDFPRPVRVNGLTNIDSITAGDNTVSALDATGKLWMWGYGASGAILDGGEREFVPKLIADPAVPPTFTRACAATALGCGLAGTDLYCWGQLYGYQVGVVPVARYTAGSDVAAISCGDYTVVVRKTDGTFLSVGLAGPALGRGYDDDASVDAGRELAVVTGVGGYTIAATGPEDTFALLADGGGAVAWGTNLGAIVTKGDVFEPRPSPTPVTGSDYLGFSSVVIGYVHACGLRDKKVFCWGNDSLGQSSYGEHASAFPPHEVSLGGDVEKLFGGGNQNCAQLTDGHVKCWGANDHGQLGNGTVTVSPAGTPDYETGRHPEPSLLLAPL